MGNSEKRLIPVIELKNVSVLSYNSLNNIVIRGIDWTVYKNDFWIVCGFGGSGKTSLLLTAAGIQKPATGSVFLFSNNITTISEDELIELRLKIGFVFETGASLFHDLTVEENITLPLRYHIECDYETALKKATDVLEFTEIENYRNALPSSLPRHLIPRVGFARALIMEPEILFIDDPMKSLDVNQERWWIETLIKLYKGTNLPIARPHTLIVAVSDLRPWINHLDKIAVLSSNCYKCFSKKDVDAEKPDPVLAEFLFGANIKSV